MLFVLATPEAITVHVPNVGPRKIFNNSPVYQDVKDLLLGDANIESYERLSDEVKVDRLLRLLDRSKRIADGSEGKLLLVDGHFKMDGEYLPALFTKRLLELEGTSMVNSLANLWKNLRNNPSERSRTELLSFLEKNEMPITEDGHFLAYKYVTKDLRDARTGTFDNSPGSEPTMPREAVDDDSSVTCSRGLHVAAFQYAKNNGSTLVAVKVNPVDVVSIPFDYNGQKMRVCKYKVLEVISGEIEGFFYDEKKPQSIIEDAVKKVAESVIEDVHEEVTEPVIEDEPFEMTIKEPVDTKLNYLNQTRGAGGRWVKKAK